LGGCGPGSDADKLGAAERARLRKQALDWLRADLTYWTKQVAKVAMAVQGGVSGAARPSRSCRRWRRVRPPRATPAPANSGQSGRRSASASAERSPRKCYIGAIVVDDAPVPPEEQIPRCRTCGGRHVMREILTIVGSAHAEEPS
jgi:hypothetical protein